MLRRILITTSILTVAASFSFAQGCSSSSGGGTSSGSGSSSGGENDATGSSSGSASSSSGSVGDDATGSSSGGSGSSSGGVGDASGDGPDLCTSPLSTVPAGMITGYMTVMQTIGACTGTDISGFITACNSSTASDTACNTWFNGAPQNCANCLIGPVTGGDPGNPTGQGGIWFWNMENIGVNFPGCMDKEGQTACATAYANLAECIYAAGCLQCADQTSFDSCQNTVAAGACKSYVAPYQNACPQSDFADGGVAGPTGACGTDQGVLSVICGNGSGDGG